MKDIRDYSLLGHNTFGIDARCRRYLEYASAEEAQLICRGLAEADRPLLLIGEGSNLLLTADYAGTVITPERRFDVAVRTVDTDADGVYLDCWAGTTFDDVVAYAVAHGYHGAENLSLIPGEVGASAVQNIGAYGAEAQDIIVRVQAVEIATGRRVEMTKEECQYSYRQSKFKHEWRDRYLITSVTYRLHRSFTPHLDYGNIRARLAELHIEHPTASQLRDVIVAIRRDKLPDPKELGNAGSFFMNPMVSREQYERLHAQYPDMPHYTIDDHTEKIPAGWMIDQCGWRGRTVGHVGVHDRQALVLVNRGGATGGEVVALYQAIQRDVKQKFGIDIHPEVNVK